MNACLRVPQILSFDYEVRAFDRFGVEKHSEFTSARSLLRNLAVMLHGVITRQTLNVNEAFAGGVIASQFATAFSTDAVRLAIGSGSLVVDMNNFQLTTEVENQLSASSVEVDTASEYKWKTTYLFTITSPVTIREIGMKMSMHGNQVLLARDLITPVACAVDETFRVTYSISIVP